MLILIGGTSSYKQKFDVFSISLLEEFTYLLQVTV